MDLEQEPPETVETEPATPEVADEPDIADSPSSEPRSRQDDVLTERLRSVEAQARVYQEEAERNRRELEAMRQAQRVDPREEQARIDAMDPEQRVLYLYDKGTRQTEAQIANIESRTTAQIDQLKFDAQLDKTSANLGWSSAQKARYAAEVEAQYNYWLQRGTMVPRSDLLKHKLGDELMTTGAKAIKGATDKGKANIAKQSSKMTPASSNVTGKSTGKSKAQEAMERMLQAGVLEM